MEHMSPEIFISYYYKTENGDATFHTDDVKTAERLIDDDRKISHPNSFKMIIKVRGHTPQAKAERKHEVGDGPRFAGRIYGLVSTHRNASRSGSVNI